MVTVVGNVYDKVEDIDWGDVQSRASQSTVDSMNILIGTVNTSVQTIYGILLNIQNTLLPNLEDNVDDIWDAFYTESGVSGLIEDAIAYFPTLSVNDLYRLLMWIKGKVTTVFRITPAGSIYLPVGTRAKELAVIVKDYLDVETLRIPVTKSIINTEDFPDIKLYMKYNIEINTGTWTNWFTMPIFGIFWWPLFFADPYITGSELVNPDDNVLSLVTGTNIGFYMSDAVGEFLLFLCTGFVAYLGPGLGIKIYNWATSFGGQTPMNANDYLGRIFHTTCEEDE